MKYRSRLAGIFQFAWQWFGSKYGVITAFLVLSLLALLALSQLSPDAVNPDRLEVPFLILAFVLALVSRGLLFLGLWFTARVLSPLKQIRFRPGFSTFGLAWLARYIPGKVAPALVRMRLSSTLGLNKTQAAVSQLYEGLFQLVSNASIVAISAGVVGREWGVWSPHPVWALAPLLLLATFYPPLLRGLLKILGKRIRRRGIAEVRLITFLQVFWLMAPYIVLSLTNGLVLMSIARGYGISVLPDDFAFFLFAASLASIGSALVFMLPSGIGAAEFAISMGLFSLGVPFSVSLAVAVIWRVISIVSDLVFVGFSQVFRLGRK